MKKAKKPWQKAFQTIQHKKKKAALKTIQKKKKKTAPISEVTRTEIKTLGKLLTEASDELLKLRAKMISLTGIWEAKLREGEENDDIPF